MTETQVNKERFDHILALLNDAGLEAKYVLSMLPNYVPEAAAQTFSGLIELKIFLARRFGLSVSELLLEEPQITFTATTAKFKRSRNIDERRLSPSTSMALAAAKIVESATLKEYSPPPTAMDIRNAILDEYGAKWVSLKSILLYCQNLGLPVIPYRRSPYNNPKPDGLVVGASSRPIVLIGKRTPFKAWSSFVLAHELGHVANGDISAGELLVDSSFESLSSSIDDEEERGADKFALDLLSGNAELNLNFFSNLATPRKLAHAAMREGTDRRIDPGHLLLRFAFQTGEWQLPLASLQVIDNIDEGATELKEMFFTSLDPELLTSENLEFLLKLTNDPPQS